MINALYFAAGALAIAGGAFSLARIENDRGQYWAGLISGLLALATACTAGFSLLRTEIATASYYVSVFVALRIAMEVGFSFSAIVCHDA